MPSTERRFLLCNDKCVKESDLYLYPKYHILGEIIRIKFEGIDITVLAKWEIPISATYIKSENIPTDLPIDEHTVMVINMRCKYPDCNHKVNWELNKYSRDALFSRYSKVSSEKEKV